MHTPWRCRALFALITLAILLIVPVPVVAQSDTSSLSVVVRDTSEAAVPGAAVVLRQAATGLTRESTTDARGRVVFTVLPPGVYEATVTLEGFRQFRDDGLRLQVAQSATLDVTLEIGAVAEALEVTAPARLLSVDSSARGTVIDEETVQTLPLNGRQFINLALLVPGANAGGRAVQQNATGRLNQTGGLSIGGGRTNNTLFLIDGAVDTDPDYNSLNYSPSIDAIAEFQVQTSQFPAEYGRAERRSTS